MDFWRILENPQVLHSVAVHFPVALGVLGLPLVVVAALTKMRPVMRQVVLAVYLLLALAAFLATTTGSAVPVKSAGANVVEAVELHSFLGRYVWIGAMATAVLILLTLVRSEWFRAMFTVLGVLAAAVTTALIVATAFEGQALVYEHGLGAKPKPAANAAAAVPKAPAQPGPAELEGIEPAGTAPDMPAAGAGSAEGASAKAASGSSEEAEKVLAQWKQRLKSSPSKEETSWEKAQKWFKRYVWPW